MTDQSKPRAAADAFLAMARSHLAAAKLNVRVAEMLLTGRVPETESGILEAANRAIIAEAAQGLIR